MSNIASESSSATLEPSPAIKGKGVFSWMLFDWAAQPFFTVIITFIFGPYFVSRLAENPVAGQAAWGYTVTVSGVVIALLSPLLGSIADASGARKPWIAGFAIIKILSLAALWWAAPGSSLLLPALCIVLATVAAEFSIVFNDSLLPGLAPASRTGRISNLAWGLGYAGGLVVLFSVLLLLAADPATGKTLLGIAPLWGLDPASGEDARITGPYAALWYLIFILPMFLFTPDHAAGLPLRRAISAGFNELLGTFRAMRERAIIFRFLIARMIYQDGVNGLLALGGTFAAGMFGWQTLEMGLYGIMLLIVAIGGCYMASRLALKTGSERVIVLGLVCLTLACIGIISTGPGYTLFGWWQFAEVSGEGLFSTGAEKAYVIFGMLIGLAFGPVQASSRSWLADRVSADEAGRYFGLYALSGRVTSFLAPLSVATITWYTQSARLGMCALIVFLLVGLALLLWANEKAPAHEARSQ